MTAVQNVGVNDYPAQMQDMQPVDYPEVAGDMAVYDPEMEEKRAAAKGQTGMMALGVLGLAGIALGGIKWHSANKLGKQVKRLEAENADMMKKLAENKETLTNEFKGSSIKRFGIRLARVFKPTAFMTDAEKAARQEAKDAAKAAKEAEKAAKKAEKEAAKEAKKSNKK